MKTYKADFTTVTKNGIVESIGRTYIEQPEIKWNGKGIKWFDDSQLMKKQPVTTSIGSTLSGLQLAV